MWHLRGEDCWNWVHCCRGGDQHQMACFGLDGPQPYHGCVLCLLLHSPRLNARHGCTVPRPYLLPWPHQSSSRMPPCAIERCLFPARRAGACRPASLCRLLRQSPSQMKAAPAEEIATRTCLLKAASMHAWHDMSHRQMSGVHRPKHASPLHVAALPQRVLLSSACASGAELQPRGAGGKLTMRHAWELVVLPQNEKCLKP